MVRVHWTTGELTKPTAALLPARVGIETLRGYQAEAAQVRKSLIKRSDLQRVTSPGSTWSADCRRCGPP